MQRRLGLALALGLALVTIGSGQTLAEHGAGETFAQMTVGEAPEPTVGYTVTADGDVPVDRGRTVETFEIPDRFDEFYLYLTEINTEVVRGELWDTIYAEAPSGASATVYEYEGGLGGATYVCAPVQLSCSYELHPGYAAPSTVPAEDGTYELVFEGLSTGSYEVTAYGFPAS